MLGIVKAVIILCIFTLASFVICWIALINSNNFFLNEVKESDMVINDYKPVIEQQKKIENKLNSVEKIKANYKYWTKFNMYLYENVPKGIYLSFVNTTDDIVNIDGYAMTKNDIGLFRDAIENTDAFSQVNIESIKETDDPTQEGRTVNLFNIKAKLQTEATSKGAMK